MSQPDLNPLPPANTQEPPEASPPEEPTPMLDVHPAHHAASTWRDFFIHIATIVLGLLIAIGLEQAVESLHHRHQRHQLEEDLREEGIRNKATIELSFRRIDANMRRVLDQKDYVDSMRSAHSPLPMPAQLVADLAEQRKNATVNIPRPSTTVWTTARESQLVALLPRELARAYSRVYLSESEAEATTVAWLEANTRVGDFTSRFGDRSSPATVNYAHMTDQDLDQYSALLSALFNRLGAQKRSYARFYGSNNVMLKADTERPPSEDDMARASGQAATAVWNDSGPVLQTPAANEPQ
jgi:hypothetical protein